MTTCLVNYIFDVTIGKLEITFETKLRVEKVEKLFTVCNFFVCLNVFTYCLWVRSNVVCLCSRKKVKILLFCYNCDSIAWPIICCFFNYIIVLYVNCTQLYGYGIKSMKIFIIKKHFLNGCHIQSQFLVFISNEYNKQ